MFPVEWLFPGAPFSLEYTPSFIHVTRGLVFLSIFCSFRKPRLDKLPHARRRALRACVRLLLMGCGALVSPAVEYE